MPLVLPWIAAMLIAGCLEEWARRTNRFELRPLFAAAMFGFGVVLIYIAIVHPEMGKAST